MAAKGLSSSLRYRGALVGRLGHAPHPSAIVTKSGYICTGQTASVAVKAWNDQCAPLVRCLARWGMARYSYHLGA